MYPHSFEEESYVEPEFDVDTPVDPEPAPAHKTERTNVPYPSKPEGYADWHEYFVALHSVPAQAEAEQPRVISQGEEQPLSVSPKKYVAAAEALGLRVEYRYSVVWHPDTFQKSDGKKRQAGELVKAAHHVKHLWVGAHHLKAKLGFVAHWEDGRFVEATAYDPLGWPVEFWFDYEPTKAEAVADPQARRKAAERDLKYNDADTYTVHRTRFTQSGELDDWLDGYLIQVGAKTLSRKKKAEPEPEENTWYG